MTNSFHKQQQELFDSNAFHPPWTWAKCKLSLYLSHITVSKHFILSLKTTTLKLAHVFQHLLGYFYCANSLACDIYGNKWYERIKAIRLKEESLTGHN